MTKLKVKGNFNSALSELKSDKNNVVSYLYKDLPTFDGPLKDCVFTIKDVFATNDAPTQASSKILENFQPSYNAYPVELLINAGAKKVAKVHSDELALGGTGLHSVYGIIKNPKDKSKQSGGSSSGSVASFSKNISFALGSDTGDSVRLPASFNGVVGFKPSYGAISRYGMFAYASSLDTVAYFTHNVHDAYELAKVLYQVDKRDFTNVEVKLSENNKAKKPKSVLALDVSKYCEKYVADSYTKLLDELKKQNVDIKLVEPNLEVLRSVRATYKIISFSEASSNLANLTGVAFGNREKGSSWEEVMTNTRSKHLGKMVQERLVLGSYFLFDDNQKDLFLKAQKARRVIKNYWESLINSYDVVIFPAFASVASDIKNPKSYDFMDYILTTSNLTGNPSLSIPLGKHQNLDFNLSLDGKVYGDEALLQYGQFFEKLIRGIND